MQSFNGKADNPAELIWNLGLTLRAIESTFDGWPGIVFSGDGLSSMVVDNPGPGPNGLDNPGAWVLFVDGISGEQLLMVRGPDPGTAWRVSYSITGSFDVSQAGPRRPPGAHDEIVAVDFGTQLFPTGALTYVGSCAWLVSRSFAVIANDPKLPTARAVLSYNFMHPQRFVWHVGTFDGREPTRFMKTYPRSRQNPRFGP
jgi:hypothetical protein